MTGFSFRAMVYGLNTALLGLCSFLFGLAFADALFGPLSFPAAIAIGNPLSLLYFATARRLGAWMVRS